MQEVNLPQNETKSDSTEGLRQPKFLRVFYAGSDRISIALDAGTSGEVRLELVDANGARIADKPSISIDLADLPSTGAYSAQFRELHWKDATTCVEYKAYFLMTAPVAA